MSDVFERQRLTVTLCGRDYVWEEPVRRVSRAWVRDLMAIQEKTVGKTDDTLAMLGVVDDCLEYFYTHHKGMAADRAVLDNAGEQEIGEAFAALAEFVARPFANAAAAMDAGDGSTSTPSHGATS